MGKIILGKEKLLKKMDIGIINDAKIRQVQPVVLLEL